MEWWQLGVIPRSSKNPVADFALGSPVPSQQGLIWSLGAAVAQEAKIFATLVDLLRDSHLKGFICAFVLSAGCSQSSPPKPRNGGCILPCGFIYPGFCSIRKFPKLLLCLKSRAFDPRLWNDLKNWKVTHTECLSRWFQVQKSVKCW